MDQPGIAAHNSPGIGQDRQDLAQVCFSRQVQGSWNFFFNLKTDPVLFTSQQDGVQLPGFFKCFGQSGIFIRGPLFSAPGSAGYHDRIVVSDPCMFSPPPGIIFFLVCYHQSRFRKRVALPPDLSQMLVVHEPRIKTLRKLISVELEQQPALPARFLKPQNTLV